ncbi:MAG: LCP family protein [Chloroflexota bacterium]
MSRVTNRRRLVLTSLAVCGLMTGSGGFSPVAAAATFGDPVAWINFATDLIGPIVPSALPSKGSDNRLVVLLVGSDYRAQTAGTGERTDMMMLLTINNSKQIAAASLPRDVGNVPICSGAVYKPKINGLFKYLKQQNGGSRNVALDKMRLAFQCTFKIQIDYVVYMRFPAVDKLTDEVDGVFIDVPRDYFDKKINDERTPEPFGAKFLAANNVLMRGLTADDCYTVRNGDGSVNWAASPNCKRLLMYGRTRHGPGNNDWVRSKRQQTIVFDAMTRVIARGNGANLTSFQSKLGDTTDFYTDLPTDMSSVLSYYSALQGATMPNHVVFKPSKWASNVPGTSKQQLKIDVVRAWMKDFFGPL